MAFCGGLAGFAPGFIRRAVGYHLLSAMATLAAGGLLVLAYVVVARRRRRRRAGVSPRDANNHAVHAAH